MGRSELEAVLERLLAGTASEGDRIAVRAALVSGVLATGERAVAINGNASDVIIATGDGNTILSFSGADASAIREVLNAVFPTRLHELPTPPRDFTGRADELAELKAKLEQGGITISGLHGLGGIGKTALALKLADHLKSRYPDAQLYLDLKGVSREPLSVAEGLAHVIRAYRPTVKLPDTEAELRGLYQSVLEGQRTLLLMDNASSAEQVEPFIPPTSCVLLVTSRRHFTLPGLFAKNLGALSAEDARELLLAIAPRMGGFAEKVAGLCGYLPLGLRLAGSALAKSVNLTPADYALRLQDEQRRLQLIEASLNLSYELLSEDLQDRWRLLAVFPDTFEETAAASVWGLNLDQAQDMLGELIAASMVDWNETARRYRLHDLTRLFAESRLRTGEQDEGTRLHAVHYQTVLAAANDLYLRGGEAVREGLMLFDTERKNIEVGQAWSEAHAGVVEEAAELTLLYPIDNAHLLTLRLHPDERIHWFEASLLVARRLRRRDRERQALGNLGNAYADLDETKRAIEFHEQSLVIASETGNLRAESAALINLGSAYWMLGETRRAIELYKRSLTTAQQIHSRRDEGNALSGLGVAYAALGDNTRGIEFHEQYLAIVRELGDRRGEANALFNLGNAYRRLKKVSRAIAFYEQSLAISRELADRRSEGDAVTGLGTAHFLLGDFAQAIEFHEQCLFISGDIGDRRGEANALWNKSLALNEVGERAQAIKCAEQALTTFEQIEDPKAAEVNARLSAWRL